MRAINILFSIFILGFGSLRCNGDLCGNLPGGLEKLQDGAASMLPWTALIINPGGPVTGQSVYRGILVSPTLVYLSSDFFYNDKVSQLQIMRKNASYIVGLPSLPGQEIPVSFVSIHPNFNLESFWTDKQSNFALAHLSRPIELSPFVQPVCIPSFSNQQTLEEIKDTKSLLLFGQSFGEETTTCCGIRLEFLAHDMCTEYSKEVEYVADKFYCAAVSETNGHNFCQREDVGSFYQLNGSYYLGGPVRNLARNQDKCAKGIPFLIRSLKNDTLEWIKNSNKCGSDQFTCFRDGNCIPLSKLCDGKTDCADVSDEQAKYCWNLVECEEDEYQCQPYGTCIPKNEMDDPTSGCFGTEDETNHTNLYLIAGLGGSVIIIGVAATGLLCCYLERRTLKTQIRNLTEDEIDEFRKGQHQPLTDDITQSSRTQEEYCQLYINRGILKNPWKKEHEISMERIEIGKELNRGNFGVVYKGNLHSESAKMSESNKTVVVAIKTYVSTVTVEEFKNMLREVKILSHVGTHEHIVSFLGACTGNIKKRKLYLILELCELGDLLNYLQSHSQTSFETYLELDGDQADDIQTSDTTINSHRNLTVDELIKWSSQIANGMAYLETKNVIHGDLATRNILLNNTLDAKISDFGLARELNDSDIYVKSPRELLPWRWLALESFTGRIYSHKTDVWAYGVTIWEIFSLGRIPYGETRFNSDFVMKLQTGIRLPCPPIASADLYDVLLKTWSELPDSRPTFKDLQITMSTKRNSLYK